MYLHVRWQTYSYVFQPFLDSNIHQNEDYFELYKLS